jgi:Rad52/22 family double-strand break repair protein
VLLRDGTFHEDIGSGDHENPSRSLAIAHAQKEAVSDAHKRALRLFGNALGNSLYNKKHVSEVTSQGPVMAPGPDQDRMSFETFLQRKRQKQAAANGDAGVSSAGSHIATPVAGAGTPENWAPGQNLGSSASATPTQSSSAPTSQATFAANTVRNGHFSGSQPEMRQKTF